MSERKKFHDPLRNFRLDLIRGVAKWLVYLCDALGHVCPMHMMCKSPVTVMIRFRGTYCIYFWHLKGGCLFETGCLFGTGLLFDFLRKNQNVQNKTLINMKITNNNRNCHSNKLLKVQLLLKELFILAVTNIHIHYGENL